MRNRKGSVQASETVHELKTFLAFSVVVVRTRLSAALPITFFLTLHRKHSIYESRCDFYEIAKFDVRENHSMKNATKKPAAKKAAPKKKAAAKKKK